MLTKQHRQEALCRAYVRAIAAQAGLICSEPASDLVDGQGSPVKGAIASTYFQCDADRQPNFTVPQRQESATSNERGELTLGLAIPNHLDAAGVYAMRRG